MDAEKALDATFKDGEVNKILKKMTREALVFGTFSRRYRRLRESFRQAVLRVCKRHEKPNMFEAFEMMHKMDGTSQGRKKCDFVL